MITGDFVAWLYGSDTRVGTPTQNNADGEVPLSSFPSGSLASGLPKEPEWLRIEHAGLFERDTGEQSIEKRGGSAFANVGKMQWGGTLKVVPLSWNVDRATYNKLLAIRAKWYVYMYIAGYDNAGAFLTDPTSNAMRCVIEPIGDQFEGEWITLNLEWRKFGYE